ncbi:1-deoxy-D-xylulose-5-phosphate reductoisomerase [Gimibacter soli]|uniref:1-deoxy-D-xylulose 5-phosphate reductoisomerase n=1 Tax=Gimibacter soli TaxID=3024400 RepID=A0AAE9XM87_9PROT|nr:1-deoxy-D-xylulose-5-phosphate reductoisomerase [Gimibacter soli]WCL52612.1 1-deoxy-D-xylulose-5-phosphate reductoisomerase [Gimibacter soli]
MKSITILGATGSIGQSTLDLLRRNPDRFKVEALTAHCRVQELAAVAREFNARVAVIGREDLLADLKAALDGTDIEAAAGEGAIIEAASRPSDMVMAAIVGAAGLAPTLAAVRRGATVLLANKEVLVCAGDLMMAEVRQSGATLLPVDSEHNAIFQVFDFNAPERIDRIVLTASGGPCRQTPAERLPFITPAEAVAHPNWDMGAKISVDSATMMNKGLEVIEAFHLFPVKASQIEVLIHPQSVIHSMVQYVDGSTLAQLGSPDMRTPIAYCLAWPERMTAPAERLDLGRIGALTFEAPDMERFRCLALARAALEAGGAAPTVLNAANEIAVAAFLGNRLRFTDIAALVDATLSLADMKAPQSLETVFALDAEARRIADGLIMKFAA